MSNGMPKMRIDKWLWAVRLFKSRSISAEACDKGKVRIDGQAVKASRNIKVGEIISLRKGAYTIQFEVLKLTGNRLPAKITADFCKDITSHEEAEKIRLHAIETRTYGNQGGGRPTKRDRRELDEFTNF